MLRSLTTVLIFFTCTIAYSQTVNKIEAKGTLIDALDQSPLPYVNIGILNKSIGTVSDSAGHFVLPLEGENLNDTLQISLVGYHDLKMPVQQFIARFNNQTIKMNTREYVLDEVQVVVSREASETVGRTKAGGFIQIAMHPKKEIVLGTEIGMKFHGGSYPAVLKDFNWFFSGNNFKRIRMRINIYSLRKNLPDSLLLNKDINVDIQDYKTGWTKIELEQYNVVVRGDFAVSIQWLEHEIKEGEKPKIFIPGAMSSSSTSYFRVASQDKWTKTKTNLCYYVTLLH